MFRFGKTRLNVAFQTPTTNVLETCSFFDSIFLLFDQLSLELNIFVFKSTRSPTVHCGKKIGDLQIICKTPTHKG